MSSGEIRASAQSFGASSRTLPTTIFELTIIAGMASSQDPVYAALLARAEAAEAKLKSSEAQQRRTTLHELLQTCHETFHEHLVVETEMTKTTRGGLTKPVGRKRPKVMRPWLHFDREQHDAFRCIEQQLQSLDGEPKRLFLSLLALETWNPAARKKKIAGEADIRDYHKHYVDDFIEEIYVALGKKLSFNNTSHGIDPDEEGTTDDKTSHAAIKPVNVDRFAVRIDVAGKSQLAVAVKLKPPHKLPETLLDLALRPPSNIDLKSIIQENLIYTEEPEKSMQKARHLVSVATTQTYDYMLGGGCRYGCIATGEAFVFLKIDEEDPTTVYYHMARPSIEVKGDGNHEFLFAKTSIAQLASFCWMAMESTQPDQAWLQQAIAQAPTWVVDYSQEWEKTPRKRRIELKRYARKDRAFSGSKTGAIDRSPVATRSSKRCKTDTPYPADLDDGDDDQDDGPDKDTSPMRPLVLTPKSTSHPKPQSKNTTGTSQKEVQQRPYCTQACLLGLVRARPIDERCPNASIHPRRKRSKIHHSLTQTKLCRLLREQLGRTLDEDCESLGVQGARGMLFRLTLASHGYTFVGKATITDWIPQLMHEGDVYQHLQNLQGDLIPVYLGNIDLQVPYYAFCTVLVHMLLLSYGGEPLADEKDLDGMEDQEINFERTIAAYGVQHRDLEPRNMLWNEELGRLVFIDFERSIIGPDIATKVSSHLLPFDVQALSRQIRKRKALQELAVPPGPLNKKARVLQDNDKMNPAGLSSKDDLYMGDESDRNTGLVGRSADAV
ncbi:MAG: hypothetical protein Q9219_006775 [cf. Caloplaca sp. 3 TL-2023]